MTATSRTATGAVHVLAMLSSDASEVPVAPAGDGGMAWLHATVSRFSTGSDHARRRALACAGLEAIEPAALRRAAAARTDGVLAAAAGRLDLMPHARRIPVAALAAELGAPEGLDDDIVEVAAMYAPGSPDDPGADAAVGRLVAVLGDGEAGAARICLLVQACDATAALAGNALAAGLSSKQPVDVDELVGRIVRDDPPVRTTRRVSAATGQTVVVDLASAGLTFGAGVRPCPGREHALALAAGFVAPALRRCTLAPGELRWASSPNLRVLERLDVEVA